MEISKETGAGTYLGRSITALPVLGLAPAVALVVGHTIGVGIFLTPAELIGALASPGLTLGLWLACSALVLAGAFTFGELASTYPLAGGPYIYLKEGWGEQIAFLYGWQALLVIDPGVTAALATGLAQYVALLWPAIAGGECEPR
jgi:APA family basic amino acid/polyamine antiporter